MLPLLSRNVEIKIYSSTVLFVVLCYGAVKGKDIDWGCSVWGAEGELWDWEGAGKGDCVARNIVICTWLVKWSN